MKITKLNWSAISSFHYNPEQWYASYVLGERQTSREMTFGSKIDKQIQDDPKFLPTLPRYVHMQHKMSVLFDGIELYGTPDGFNLFPGNHRLADYKTGKIPWTQKRADEHGQLTMYLLLLHVSKKVQPEEFKCFIHWIPTKEDDGFKITFRDDPVVPITFETKRTMMDLVRFGAYIKQTVKEMEHYVELKESGQTCHLCGNVLEKVKIGHGPYKCRRCQKRK